MSLWDIVPAVITARTPQGFDPMAIGTNHRMGQTLTDTRGACFLEPSEILAPRSRERFSVEAFGTAYGKR
jgi:hypothetical protein